MGEPAIQACLARLRSTAQVGLTYGPTWMSVFATATRAGGDKLREAIPQQTVEQLEPSLNRLRFENPDVSDQEAIVSDRPYAGQDKSRCLKKRSPFALAALSPAGDSKHVEVAHRVTFQLRIWMRDERRKDKFNDQQTAVLRNGCVAILEHLYSIPVLTPVQYMLKHVSGVSTFSQAAAA